MATIGTFTHDRDGFLVGSIRTLTLDTPAQMEPIASDTQGAPAYRLYAGEVELGAAWAKTARESGRAYHQVRLDDPSFPAPIFANLIANEDAGTYSLVWNRPKSAQKGRGARPARETRPGTPGQGAAHQGAANQGAANQGAANQGAANQGAAKPLSAVRRGWARG